MPKKLPRSFVPKRRLRHRPSDLNESGMLRRRSVYRITPEREAWLVALASKFPARGGWPDRGLALSILLDWAFDQLGVGAPSALPNKLDGMLTTPESRRDDPDLDGDGPPTRSPNFSGW